MIERCSQQADNYNSWMPHIVQNFVHGANVAIAHLHHEAALTHSRAPQAGRPYVVTDPNPPIMYRDMYLAVKTLSINPPVEVILQPIIMLILAHILEFYSLLPYRLPLLRALLPELKGDVRYLKPGLFSICTHLVGANTEISKPLSEGGLGYKGVLTTLEGVTLEVLEWNREHTTTEGDLKRKIYTSSIAGAEKIQQLWTTSLNGSA